MNLQRPAWAAAAALLAAAACSAAPSAKARPADALARDIFQQLIEINTTESVGNVTTAAQAMAQRLREAGFSAADITVIGPNERKKNMVARLRGSGRHKPVLLIGHLDVVEARREDWATDPFKLVEKDGYFYGRGTVDMKNGDAVMVASMIRLKKEGFQPSRDIVLALTADEEGGSSNGVEWLLKNHRTLVDAEFVINMDDYSIIADKGKPQFYGMAATLKVYADFELMTTNPGGHSSLPTPENAIYELAHGLARIEKFKFPFELNNVTRPQFAGMSHLESGQRADDMRAIVQEPPDPAALDRLSRDVALNSIMRTTCIATRLDAGHANNALPQRARANVNCRILPAHSPEEVRQTLIGVLANPKITVRFVNEKGEVFAPAPDTRGFPPPPLLPAVMQPLNRLVGEFWPGLTVIPTMSAGVTDDVFVSAAGLASYIVTGFKLDRDDDRSHGMDERIGTESFYVGNEFMYRYMKALTAR